MNKSTDPATDSRVPDFPRTERQFDKAIGECRQVYASKLRDYGASWRLMRPTAVTDQILIKADRIRTLETKGECLVDEPIDDAFRAMVNYGIIGLIQLQLGYADKKDITPEEALKLYDTHMAATRKVMLAKNHDYNEAWRKMRVSSYTDLILMKLMRTKEIEDNQGHTEVSEGIDANYQDIINYAIFGLIKLANDEK
jgi:hypothetical protein